MNEYQHSMNYLNKSVCTALVCMGIDYSEDKQLVKSIHKLQELVNKQEPMELIKEAPNKYRCPTCNAIHTPDSLPNYCFNCGQKFKL